MKGTTHLYTSIPTQQTCFPSIAIIKVFKFENYEEKLIILNRPWTNCSIFSADVSLRKNQAELDDKEVKNAQTSGTVGGKGVFIKYYIIYNT